jgi:hypothetical protein
MVDQWKLERSAPIEKPANQFFFIQVIFDKIKITGVSTHVDLRLGYYENRRRRNEFENYYRRHTGNRFLLGSGLGRDTAARRMVRYHACSGALEQNLL